MPTSHHGPSAPDGSPYSAPQRLVLGRDSFKRVSDGVESMNVDGVASGSEVTLWNGTGALDSGGDWTAGDTGSESSASMHSGTNGWDTGVSLLDQSTSFDNGAMIDVDSLYDELRFWVQPKAFPVGSRPRVAFFNTSDVRVGNALLIRDYTSNMDLDAWQQIAIPIDDFALTETVQKLRFTYRSVASQRYWFDDIGLLTASGAGPFRYRVEPPEGEQWHMSMLVLQVIAPESGWASDAFASISGGLTNGLLLRQRRLSTGDALWRFATRSNTEIFGQYHPQESFAFSDGNLLLGFMIKPGKASVVVTADDVLEFVVRDDLSSIPDIRAYLHYGVEEI